MKLLIAIVVLAFLFGMALGAWLLRWVGRWAEGRHTAVIEQMIWKADREGFDRGFAAALGLRAAIDEPADHERSARW